MYIAWSVDSNRCRGTHRFTDVEQLASRIEVERVAAEQDRISCLSGSNIQFTSGTTGKPKATLLSHRSLLNNAKQVYVYICIYTDILMYIRHVYFINIYIYRAYRGQNSRSGRRFAWTFHSSMCTAWSKVCWACFIPESRSCSSPAPSILRNRWTR